MRSSYSMPSAFICCTASPRAWCCWASSTWRGPSSTASTTLSVSTAWSGLCGSSRSRAAIANWASGWLSAKSSGRSTVSTSRRPCSSGSSSRVDQARAQQCPGVAHRASRQAQLAAPVLVAVLDQVPHRGEGVLLAGEDVDQQGVVDLHLRPQRLGRPGRPACRRSARSTRPCPREASCAAPCGASSGRPRPWPGPLVLDHVLGCLHHDVADRVEARPAGAAGDLVELALLEDPLAGAVVLRQPGEEHRPDRHVDADAQGVGAADDAQQALLGQLLDQAPVARQHPGVVHPDARRAAAGQGPAEAGAEAEVADARRPRGHARRGRAAADRARACSVVAWATAAAWVKCTT